MVLPVLDYCDVVWDTLSDTQQNKLEKLQTRAETIINMYQSYDLNIHWPSLVSRRKMHTAILAFKCLSNRVPSFLRDYIHLVNPTRITRNCMYKCDIPKVNLVFGSKGFYVRGPQVVNNLPSRIHEENVFKNFRKKVIEYFSILQYDLSSIDS